MKKKMKLILEFTEFNLNRLNSDSTSVSMGLAPDKQLSVNAFDRFEDDIRTSSSRINNIMKSLTNTSAFNSLKSKINFEKQNPTSLKILRIIPNNVDYYVYISFIIADNEYDGVIQNILSKTPKLISNVFSDNKNLVQSHEWQVRLKGLLSQTIKKWLEPELGKYQTLKDIECTNFTNGTIKTIKLGSTIEVVKTVSFENKIVIKFDNDLYNLTNSNFVYFNYWFKKLN
jgi:hypothetical protein